MASSERFEGVMNGEKISVFREIGGHRLTDLEVEALLRGEYIAFPAVSSKDTEYLAVGHLEKDGKYWKFRMEFEYDGKVFCDPASQRPPKAWCNYTFTDSELAALTRGETINAGPFTWKSGKSGKADVAWVDEKGNGIRRLKPMFN